MVTKLKIFFTKLFLSKEKQAQRIIDKVSYLIKQLDKLEGIELALSFTAQVIVLTEKTDEVVCIIEVQDVGYSVDIITNSLLTTPLVAAIISRRVKKEFTGTHREIGTELAYNSDLPIMLVGEAARQYLGQEKNKPKLTIVNPDDLN